MEHTVVALMPNGDTSRFPNIYIAKAMLLKKYHEYIFTSADDIYSKLSDHKMDALIETLCTQHKLVQEPRSGREKAVYLYQLMHTYADKIFEEGKKGKIILVKRKETAEEIDDGPMELKSYWLLYEPGVDPMMDAAFIKLAPQARAVLSVLLEHQKLHGEIMSEPTVYKYIMRDKIHLKTKQNPWRIFKYYRSTLVSQNFMRMTK